jgi:hypothetical protein
VSPIAKAETWADNNLMKLNSKKCKEMHICFLIARCPLERLNLEGHPLGIVSSRKVLGLHVIQNNLKWNGHIAMTVGKAFKRFHILRILKRGGIPPHELNYPYLLCTHSLLFGVLLYYVA